MLETKPKKQLFSRYFSTTITDEGRLSLKVLTITRTFFFGLTLRSTRTFPSGEITFIFPLFSTIATEAVFGNPLQILTSALVVAVLKSEVAKERIPPVESLFATV